MILIRNCLVTQARNIDIVSGRRFSITFREGVFIEGRDTETVVAALEELVRLLKKHAPATVLGLFLRSGAKARLFRESYLHLDISGLGLPCNGTSLQGQVPTKCR